MNWIKFLRIVLDIKAAYDKGGQWYPSHCFICHTKFSQPFMQDGAPTVICDEGHTLQKGRYLEPLPPKPHYEGKI